MFSSWRISLQISGDGGKKPQVLCIWGECVASTGAYEGAFRLSLVLVYRGSHHSSGESFQYLFIIVSSSETSNFQALVVQNIKLIGELANILVRVLILGVAGYVIVGFSRISKASSTSIVWFPLQRTLQPNWKALISGRAWVDAMLFVIQSMELGTLVHPYLGSKNFFHYRCHRDGLYLVLIAFLWNLGASVASLTWLGYVGVNRVQMEAARRLLHGQYGLTLVYELKHVQGEMTQNVQGDCLFFLAVFYSMVGIAGE